MIKNAPQLRRQSSGVAGEAGLSVPHDCGDSSPALRVLVGDCRKVLKELEPESVQCCVTSPPYWGLRDYGHAEQIGREATPENYVESIVASMRELWRVLKPDGTLWLNLGDSYAGSWGNYVAEGSTSAKALDKRRKDCYGVKKPPMASFRAGSGRADGKVDERGQRNRNGCPCPAGLKPKDLVGIPWRVAFALQADGWWLRSDIIWAKANCMPESVTDRPTRSHEYIFLLTKSERYFYDAEAIKEPASEADWESRIGRANLNNKLLPTEEINGIRMRVKYTPNKKDKRRGHSRRHDGFNDRWDHMEKAEQCAGMRNKRDVWTVASANYRETHFATFPAALISPCILAGSRPGDVVLDPFGGSGTTGATALALGRKAVLIELNPDYAKLIEQRTTTTLGLAL